LSLRLLALLLCIATPGAALGASLSLMDEWGSEWTLSVDDLGGGTRQATVSADTTGYSGPRTHLMAGEFKVSTDIANLVLVSAPGTADPLGDWDTTGGPLANGCKGNNGSFGCSFADFDDPVSPFYGSALADRDEHTWVWTFEDDGTLFNGWLGDGPIDEGHIGSQYWTITFDSVAPIAKTKGGKNSKGTKTSKATSQTAANFEKTKGHIVSLQAQSQPHPIPEPGSALLFGAGALLVGGALRRQTHR